MLQLGDFKLPTFGDLVNGGEAMIGNVVEGLIEGVTGEKVELTPGNGVDNTRVEGARGKGEIKFEQKLATLDDQEKLRREVEQKLTKLQTEVTKLKMKQQSDRQLRPAVTGQGHQFATNQMMGGSGQQQLPILLALTRAVPGLAHDPLILMSLMQQMGNGGFGGMDPMTFAAMQALSGVFAPQPQPMVRALNAPQPNPVVTIPQPNPNP